MILQNTASRIHPVGSPALIHVARAEHRTAVDHIGAGRWLLLHASCRGRLPLDLGGTTRLVSPKGGKPGLCCSRPPEPQPYPGVCNKGRHCYPSPEGRPTHLNHQVYLIHTNRRCRALNCVVCFVLFTAMMRICANRICLDAILWKRTKQQLG